MYQTCFHFVCTVSFLILSVFTKSHDKAMLNCIFNQLMPYDLYSVDILAVTETHIHQEDKDRLIGYKFCHKPHIHGRGGGVGFFINKTIQFRSLDSPTFSSFENISIIIGSFAQPLVLTCVYRPTGLCSDGFLD